MIRNTKELPPIELFLKNFTYDPETGVVKWREKGLGRRNNLIAGTLDNYGYRSIIMDGGHYKAHRIAWLLTHGSWPTNEIDHINGIRDDNRISNLREATHAENIRNQTIRSDNKSGFKGVSWHKEKGKWQAHLSASGGKTRYLGRFSSIEGAVAAVKAARQLHHGEFSNHG